MDIKERARDIAERAKRIILSPKSEWAAIEAEPITVREIYLNYVVYLAAIPAVANFLGNWLFGFARGSDGVVHTTFFGGLWRALAQYGLGLPLIYLVAIAISRLAPSFEGKSDDLRAFKLVAFSYTPIWLAEIFGLVPGLRWLDVLGLYAVYLFYVGVARMTRSKDEYADVYTAAGVGLGIAAAFLHGAFIHLIAPL
ncbi:Yip1 family protein [Methylosinus sp. Sm6]|uniref:Yip1 family protein n=1 Tax=Methylosinus sp. Sm6 TaxID=2866948 RepID=UPI001C991324|nr:Yip1 family protein [Methylosinus sp. Sm6]MBY6242047.1 YIP1 family protein [Methylosinus sp. Sm6]